MKKEDERTNTNWASVAAAGGTILGLLALATMFFIPTTRANSPGAPNVIDRDSVAYGRTYGEWSAAWWQWAFSIPVASHPLFDNGDCSVGQSGAVWFLGGKFCQVGQICSGSATRSCSVPAGKALYFPILNVEDSAPEEPRFGCGDSLPPLVAGTIAEMRLCDELVMDGTHDMSAEIDGVAVPDVQNRFRVQSSAFGITLPKDNLLNAIGEGPFPKGTSFPTVDDGVYLMLSPLPPGTHVLQFQGTFSSGFTESITYNLSVGK
jgi:hypothetical protein